MTHLNYAFAYIDPATYELVTMDSQTPERLFELAVETKNYNPALKVWVSVGGWTFSDNHTATQPVFGDIASSAQKRQKFADNVARFLSHYGFDGLDIDWEYPGAPDRGGKAEDTDNFVELMTTLRSTFNKYTRELGLSFTIPASYWYLRWFDLPGMMKYADWTNMMTYDIHGAWDRDNPIGSIVQGHTNLTEIKQAAELLWRVGIKPEKVVMGFGFYGRSFQLQDPSCTNPGCQFHGDATPGPCSKTSGILMYYEIQAINYVVFDKNQWVSFDGAEAFKQKLEWANEIGMGGSLIWASDTDDDQYSAMSGFMGKKVSHPDLAQKALSQTPFTIVEDLVGENGQDCKLGKECVDPNIVKCGRGQRTLGWDKAGCKSGGKLICCPTASSPRSCTWRGGTGDCNGQCHPGEATLFWSSWGGGFEAQSDTTRCSRGAKVFCCEAGNWKKATEGCYWTHWYDRSLMFLVSRVTNAKVA
ncbi:glycoside hydrolase family 18 protein [Aspergillus melleus]|uniref:glycoside hydrolase family 18 protein n=1 Tax=Aspergillus melleus TaxID=138277 RepID=UPI001E8E475B|nr:uncharacterized protein LDX57_005689 [Aspergillus melleus]KAH8427983.1 hypothetical protein LDX57_005689 [Aspergillus melleus]